MASRSRRTAAKRRSSAPESSPLPVVRLTPASVAARVAAVVAVVGIYCAMIYDAYAQLVTTDTVRTAERTLALPSDLAQVRAQAQLLRAVAESHPRHVLQLLAGVYLLKQSFGIPGSMLLNVLAGAVFGSVRGCLIVCVLSSVGSSICYVLSQHVFGDVVLSMLLTRPRWAGLCKSLEQFRGRVAALGRGGGPLLWWLIGLRVFPLSPNWFINLVSPFVGVPLAAHSISVLVGLAPYNYVCVEAASFLSELASTSDIFSTRVLLRLAFTATAVLGFAFLKSRRS